MSSTPDQSLSDHDEMVLPSFAMSFYQTPSPKELKPGKVQETPEDMTYMTLNQGNNLTDLQPMETSQTAKQIYEQFCNIKKEPNLCSWKNLQPGEWNSGNVLDFLFYLEEKLDDDNQIRSDRFQNIDGKKLCSMPLHELQKRDPEFGQSIYDELKNLQDEGTKYFQNDPLDLSTAPVNSFLKELQTSDIEHDEYLGSILLSEYSSIPVGIEYQFDYSQDILNNNTTTNTDQQHNYDYNPRDTFPEIVHDESGYDSAASRCSTSTDEAFEMPPHGVPIPVFTQIDDQECPMDHLSHFQHGIDSTQLSNLPGNKLSSEPKAAQEKRRPGRPPNRLSSVGSESSDDAPVIKKTRGRKMGQMSKAGNHLWEFIRDLLKDPQYNPGLIKWEDAEEGVFRIVKSSEVSKLWGKKKNNAQMNYEKLSRAMRFCRCERYFSEVPKDGRFPKKLCFKFGERAFGWK